MRVMRPESYWFQETGTVATVDKNAGNRYGVVCRFDKVNYAGVATNNFAIDELIVVSNPPAKAKAKAAPRANPPAMSMSMIGRVSTYAENRAISKTMPFDTLNLEPAFTTTKHGNGDIGV